MSGCSFPNRFRCSTRTAAVSIEDQLRFPARPARGRRKPAGTAHFSSTAGDAFRKVAEGHLTGYCSVGYSVDDSYWTPEGETGICRGIRKRRSFAGPVRVVANGPSGEGSLTPIGAVVAAKDTSQQCNPEATMPNTLSLPDDARNPSRPRPEKTAPLRSRCRHRSRRGTEPSSPDDAYAADVLSSPSGTDARNWRNAPSASM